MEELVTGFYFNKYHCPASNNTNSIISWLTPDDFYSYYCISYVYSVYMTCMELLVGVADVSPLIILNSLPYGRD